MSSEFLTHYDCWLHSNNVWEHCNLKSRLIMMFICSYGWTALNSDCSWKELLILKVHCQNGTGQGWLKDIFMNVNVSFEIPVLWHNAVCSRMCWVNMFRPYVLSGWVRIRSVGELNELLKDRQGLYLWRSQKKQMVWMESQMVQMEGLYWPKYE